MIRRGDANDVAFLRDMLRHAYYARWGEDDVFPGKWKGGGAGATRR
jgi:hypothetical protein